LALYDHAVGAVRAIYDRRLKTPPILDPVDYFPNAQRYAGRWTDIRREALAIANGLDTIPRFHDLMPQQTDISATDGRDWRMFIMRAYGVTVDDNLARCPTVAALLHETPEVISAVFSFLAPGKHIPRHRGPFRGILRFHLMLSTPRDEFGAPACELNIDSLPYRLGDGEMLLWDDTFPHEVWNRSNEMRIALLLDVWREHMPADVEILSQALLGVIKIWLKTRGASYSA
jgi:aspartate beta-hydroxylase